MEIKCKCLIETCEMKLRVSTDDLGNVIWMEIDGISTNLKRFNPDKEGWVTTRLAFALDMNDAFNLITELKKAVAEKFGIE